ncbi:hypothetical protein BGZ61DRAFT_434384 [Ilyonectria robusta]|uniref:uncharacterized protein n=1 Tax=Ilyonectria robusta TaxID=1079257 RepID=UPI001E8EC3CE|nr:uncharacterized protein BGZ61DRAFT_434384 [Ilyonectria robusta]KAH8656439.1 hypothetical protein BGZ61DRAFT_434384 [Ilyonectria robusta]
MVGSANSRKRVYISCRAIFSGNNAQVRKQKKVKELVEKSRKSLKTLLQDLGHDTVIAILRSLLEGKIFESEIRAKIEFPELFRSSTIRDVQRQASEADAANSTAEALDEITSQDGEQLDREEDGVEPEESEDGVPTIAPVLYTMQEPQGKLPSLYPSYLPYQTQHLILNTAQQILEECCFNFASISMPSVLQQKRWDCSTAGELTQWTKLFRKGKGRPYTAALDFKDKELLKEVSNLRHTAVHRLPTTARGVSQLLKSATVFAQYLQDGLRAAQLEELQSDVDSKIKAMELNKNVLEDTASSKLQDIQRQREELDRMEAKLIEEILQEDLDNKALIGQLLEDSVRGIFRLQRDATNKDCREDYEGKEENEENEGDEENEEDKDRDEEKGKGEDEVKEEDEVEGGKDSEETQGEERKVEVSHFGVIS